MCVIVWWRRGFRFQRRRSAAEIGVGWYPTALLSDAPFAPAGGEPSSRSTGYVDLGHSGSRSSGVLADSGWLWIPFLYLPVGQSISMW